MKHVNAGTKRTLALALALAGMLTTVPAMAEKPSWAGGENRARDERMNKRDNHEGGQRDADERSSRDSGRSASGRRDHFEERHRTIVREYYSEHYRDGRCPPGLAKKHNGCMPPGQAKKWHFGQPLPREVVFHAVPHALVAQFERPPAGYRYVRVASDILLMSIGTRMIIDAIQDLGRT